MGRGDDWVTLVAQWAPEDIMFAPVVLPDAPDPNILVDTFSGEQEFVVLSEEKSLHPDWFKIVHKTRRKPPRAASFVTASPAADAISQMRSVYKREWKKFEQVTRQAPKEDPDPFADYPPSPEVKEAAHHLVDSVREVAEEALKPFVESFEVQRKEEQRKSKNLLEKVKGLFSVLQSPVVAGSATNTYRRLQYLGYVIDGLYRLRKRFDRYTEFQRDFSFQGFNVINKYGYSEDEMQQPLHQLAVAAKRLEEKGFGKLNYGDVLLVNTPHRKDESARYFSEGDKFRLQVNVRRRFNTVYTIVHELGHRYWYKFLTDFDREWYEDEFFLDAKLVTPEERQKMWEALQAANYWPTKAARILLNQKDTELAEEVVARFKYVLKARRTTIKSLREDRYDMRKYFEQHFLAPEAKDVHPRREVTPYPSVTSYARTNVREDFAEAFAHYIFDKKIPQDQNMRILGVLP